METAGLLLHSWIGVLKSYWMYVLVILVADVYLFYTTHKRLKKMRKALAFSIAIETVVMIVVPLVGFMLINVSL